MIGYKGQHSVLKQQGSFYWKGTSDQLEGIPNGYRFFSTKNTVGENQRTRFSVRFSLKGVQHYRLEETDLHVTPDNFLIMNHGVDYDIHSVDAEEITMMSFCFNEQFVSDFVSNTKFSQCYLLDNYDQYKEDNERLEFPVHTFQMDEDLHSFLQTAIASKSLSPDEVDDQWIFSTLLENLLKHNQTLLQSFDGQGIIKESTKKELFRRLSIARDYIQVHFTEDINLYELSRVACLSPYHFHRAFKQTFNVTPKKFITSLRIERAKWLLRNTEFSVQAVCNEVGFKDVSSFTRLFNTWAGMTPSVYRKNSFAA